MSEVFGTQTGDAGLAYGLAGIAEWQPALAFLDVMKYAREWVGHSADTWGAIDHTDLADQGLLDANGYPTEIPAGVEAIEALVLVELDPAATYANGRYRLTYEGEGTIQINGAAQNVVYGDGEIWFDYTATGEALIGIAITETDPNGTGNHIQGISLVKEENIDAFEAGELFNQAWLDVIDEAHALRFMDWMQTNNSTQQSVEDFPTIDSYTYKAGVPVEVMVALANETGAEPWFNIPHDADEAWITEFATYVRDNLDPGLRAHFEYTNEAWNFMFQQAADLSADAEERFGAALPDGWLQEYGARSAEMAQILDTVFAGQDDRLVKVISTMTAWPGIEESFLQAEAYVAQGNDAPYTYFDTYAVTGYFGGNLGNAHAGLVLEWVEESLRLATEQADAQGLTGEARDAYIEAHQYDYAMPLAVQELRDGSITGDREGSLAELYEQLAQQLEIAHSYGLDLVMYEGGTHVLAYGDYALNPLITDFFEYLNYSEEMGVLYAELLDVWEEVGGTLFNAFVDVSRPGTSGSWGNLRYLGDETARFDALEEFADENPRVDNGGIVLDREPLEATIADTPVEDPVEEPTEDTGEDTGEEPTQDTGETSGEDQGDASEFVMPTTTIEGTAGDDFISRHFVDADGEAMVGGVVIMAGDGDDVINDTNGTDVIYGGEGFEFISLYEDNNALDVIMDFNPGDSMISLDAQGITSFDQLFMSQIDDTSNLMINFEGDSVVLVGMWDTVNNVSLVGADSFMFAADGSEGTAVEELPQDLILVGTTGDDVLEGEAGNDFLQGEAGEDMLFGGAGNDSIVGGTQYDFQGFSDTLFGNEGDDLLVTGSGGDWIEGGAGSDSIDAGAGNDTVYVGMMVEETYGHDTVHGGEGDDQITGADGASMIEGGAGNDTITGGDDLATADRDILRGGAGDDVITSGQIYTPEEGTQQEGDILDGGQGADTLTGGEADDWLDGGEDDDMMIGNGGADTFDGGEGDDQIDGGAGGDSISGGMGNDVIFGRDGDDLIEGGYESDLIDAGSGNDTIYASDSWNNLFGNDTIFAGEGDDFVLGSKGSSMIDGGAGNDTLSGGFENDGADSDTLLGGEGDDLLTSGQDAVPTEYMTQGNGDLLYGGIGHDTLVAGLANDTLVGGAGEDVFVLRSGAAVRDTIDDFETGDLIDLSAWEVEFAELTFVQNDAHVQVSAGENALEIHNFDAAELSTSDFQGVNGVWSQIALDVLF